MIPAVFIDGVSQNAQVLSGNIKFSGLVHRTAKYIIAKDETNPKKILFEMQDKDKWNLEKPKLILSITGGSHKLNLASKTKKLIKKGLAKVCESTKSWIITTGLSNGISKMIGEALAENPRFSEFVSIGIVNLCRVASGNELIASAQNNDDQHSKKTLTYYGIKDNAYKLNRNFLDQNYSHFVLIDDDTNGDVLREEIIFRSKLERELRMGWSPNFRHYERNESYEGANEKHSMSSFNSNEGKSRETNHNVPSILICINGQFDSLLLVKESLREKVSVLIFAGTKGCADLIAKTLSTDKPNVTELIKESKIFDKQNFPSPQDEIYKDAVECLKFIIRMKNSELIHILNLDEEEKELYEEDVEYAILEAFIDSQKYKYYDNLKLTLQWNSILFARNIFNGEEYLNQHQQNHLLEIAIIENKPEFVELLIENGTNIENFLSYGRLYYFYNSKKIHMESKRAPFYDLVKSEYTINQEKLFITFKKIKDFLKSHSMEEASFNFLPIDLHFCLHEDSSVLLEIKNFLNEKYEKENVIPLCINGDGTDVSHIFKNLVEHPIQNLFMWAIFLNRIEIAKIFWQIGQNQIPNALFASILLEKLSSESSQKQELLKTSNEFVEMSVALINMFDEALDDEDNYTHLLDEVSIFGLNCLELAVIGKRMKFVSTTLVQNLLTEIWNGNVINKTDIKSRLKLFISCLSFGLLAPFLVFERKSIKYDSNELIRSETEHEFLRYLSPYYIEGQEKHEEGIELNTVRRRRKNKLYDQLYIYGTRYIDFFYSPRVNFIYDTTSYLIFLMIFSYYMLCEFSFYDTQNWAESLEPLNDSTYLNASSNFSNVTQINKPIKNPVFITYLLIFWIISFIMEEIRQFAFGESHINWKRKLIRYLRDSWNYLDMSGCFFFIVGMSLRFLAIKMLSEDLFLIAKIVLCVDLIIWYMRLLHVSLVFKSLGPKLVMIQKMVKDLTFFVCLLGIFVCAYGVTTEAAMYPSSKLNLDLLRRVVTKAYWPIYGTIKILDDFDRFQANCSAHEDCPDDFAFSYSYLLLMIYMVIANVLLINLLIAMFSNTFQRVQENADEIWKYQRHWLVYEYVNAPFLPPPLNGISYIFGILRYIILKFIKTKNSDSKEDAIEKMVFYDELERKFAEKYLDMKQDKEENSIENKLATTLFKLDMLEQKFNSFIEFQKKFNKRARKEKTESQV